MNEGDMPFDWSEEQQVHLTNLHNSGLSFTNIAAEIGCTRNAAIGKAHRLGLSAREAGKPKMSKPPKKKVVAMEKVELPPLTPPFVAPDPEPSSYQCSIDELTLATCRFPLWSFDSPAYGERFYCGAPGADLTVGRPYCKKHMRLCNPQRQ